MPDRVHLIAHAGSARKDLARLGFRGGRMLMQYARAALPAGLRLTGDPRFLEVSDVEAAGGRSDDSERIRDLQQALDDPQTHAIVAANGGAYFARILPHVDFTPLAQRRRPLWVLGFSELTTLVNLVGSYPCGRALYWLCPNYLAWKLAPRARARAAYAEFWRRLPEFTGERPALGHERGELAVGPIHGRLVRGQAASGRARLIGGCLSVLVTMLAGPLARRLRPRGRWLAIEDVKEPPYRLDRYLATLKLAGWFDQLAGVLVGDFHDGAQDHQASVVNILRFHVPSRSFPIVTTRSFGHTWPMLPVPIGHPVALRVRGQDVTIG